MVVAQSGTMARTILQGLLDSDATVSDGDGDGQKKAAQSCTQPSSPPPPSPTLAAPLPPANPQEALSAARAAITDARAFSDEIKVGVVDEQSHVTEGRPAAHTPSAEFGTGGGSSGGGSSGDQRGLGIDTTATTRVVNALQGDAVLVKSLPGFVREALEALVGGVDQQLALK